MRGALILLIAICVTPAIAEEYAEARAARYYAEGLDRPLSQLRQGAALVQACVASKACKSAQQPAANGDVIDLLDALTLFEARPASDVTAGLKARELRRAIAETGTELMREAAAYDLALFARHGATLLVCPREDDAIAYRESLDTLIEWNLSGFQALDAMALGTARENLARQESAEAEHLRAGNVEECVAARTLGEYLMQLMVSKLQPWMGEPRRTSPAREFDFEQPVKPEAPKFDARRDRELAQAVAGNFVTVVATELQLMVFPETAARIKEIAERAGFPSQD